MSKQSDAITEHDLHAYVDGQLDNERMLLVENYLANNPKDAERVKQFKLYNRCLRELFDTTSQEETTPTLSPRANKITTFSFRSAAAVFFALSLGTVLGWIVRDANLSATQATYAMVNDAFASHAVYTTEVRHPVEVSSDQDKHLFAWLSKRLKTEVKAPQLSSIGYELLGGRLLSSSGDPAAQFMYQNAVGKRLTLFLRRKKNTETTTAFQFASRHNMYGFYWVDGDLGFALIGDVEKSTLSDAAHIVYAALNED